MSEPTSNPSSMAGAFIEIPMYRCKNGHETNVAVQFMIPDDPTVSMCGVCWRDWMVSMGWKTRRIEAEAALPEA